MAARRVQRIITITAIALTPLLSSCESLERIDDMLGRKLDPAKPAPARQGTAETPTGSLADGPLAMRADEVGYFMDVHEAGLRPVLHGTGIRMERYDDVIRVTIPGAGIFDTNSDRLSVQITPTLDAIAKVLVEYNRTKITIAGHTDDRGDERYNRALSERRAKAVSRYLVNAGVDARRLEEIGHGEAHPVAGNETDDGRAANRRIEIVIEPLRRRS